MLGYCYAVRVNIWNNETNSGYGGDGICRLFSFNIEKPSKKNIQPVSDCFKNYTFFRINEHICISSLQYVCMGFIYKWLLTRYYFFLNTLDQKQIPTQFAIFISLVFMKCINLFLKLVKSYVKFLCSYEAKYKMVK